MSKRPFRVSINDFYRLTGKVKQNLTFFRFVSFCSFVIGPEEPVVPLVIVKRGPSKSGSVVDRKLYLV